MNVVSAEDLGLRLSGFGYRLTRKCGSMGELGTPIGGRSEPRAGTPDRATRMLTIHSEHGQTQLDPCPLAPRKCGSNTVSAVAVLRSGR